MRKTVKKAAAQITKKAATRVVGKPVKVAVRANTTAAKKAATKKAVGKKVPTKKIVVKKDAVKTVVIKKATAKKMPPKVSPAKKSVKKAVVKKAVVKKPPAKQIVAKLAPQVSRGAKQKSTAARVESKIASKTNSADVHQGGNASMVSTSPHPTSPKWDLSGPYKVARGIPRTLIDKDKKKPVLKSSITSLTNAPDILENDAGADPGFLQTNEVFDETDYAQHLQLMEQADISRRAREMNRPQVHPDFDGEHCVECEIDIPAVRLAAGRVRCVDCQGEIENEARRNQNLARGRSL